MLNLILTHGSFHFWSSRLQALRRNLSKDSQIKKRIAVFLIIGFCCVPTSGIYATENETILLLEKQLSGTLPSSPLQTIHELVCANLIENKAFAKADSVSYFRTKKEFKVFGMPVKLISAFDEGDRDGLWHEYFSRAPGTSPGHFIAVIIDWPKDKVKRHVIQKKLTHLDIRPADYPPFNSKKMETEIRCNGVFKESLDNNTDAKDQIKPPPIKKTFGTNGTVHLRTQIGETIPGNLQFIDQDVWKGAKND